VAVIDVDVDVPVLVARRDVVVASLWPADAASLATASLAATVSVVAAARA
jgi:hypothetical protein